MPPHTRQDGWLDPGLRIQPGKPELTPAQEAEAWRFADECVRRQLSTEPVDEQEAEAWLRQAYQVAGLAPPRRIQWVDGPLRLVAVLAAPNVRASIWNIVGASAWDSVRSIVRDRVRARVGEIGSLSLRDRIRASVEERVLVSVEECVGERVEASIWDLGERFWWKSVEGSIEASIWAYKAATGLASYAFFDTYLESHDLAALAHFNALVSGSWLGKEEVLLVRCPRRLCSDAEGRLHSETGTCLEYHDGWGISAWHGVRVPPTIQTATEAVAWSFGLSVEECHPTRET